MRRLQPRAIVALPDLYWISSEQLRLAVGRSSYLWRKIDLPMLRESFPPMVLGPDPIADQRWRIDDIAERYPHLVGHLAPHTLWLDRFRSRQVREREEYLSYRMSAASA